MRRRWTKEELETLNQLFRSYIENMSLPSLSHIRKLQQEHDVLQSRSASVIKTWVSNELQKLRKEQINVMPFNDNKYRKSNSGIKKVR